MYQAKQDRITTGIVTACIFVLAVIVFIYPIYWLLTVSLKTQREAFKTPPSLIFVPAFNHYVRLFAQADFLRYFTNSIIVSTGATALAIFLGVPAAYSLSRGTYRGKKALLFTILALQMAPPILVIIPYFTAFIRLGLIDTRIGLIIISMTFTLSFVIWSMRVFFDDIPCELEDAARIDGASDLQIFTRIIFPLITTGAVAIGITSMIITWNEFLFPLVLTRHRAITATVALMKFIAAEAEDWGLMSSGSIVLTLPVLVFPLAIRRYMTRGLISGALKG